MKAFRSVAKNCHEMRINHKEENPDSFACHHGYSDCQCMKKKIQTLLLAIMVTLIVSAGTLSARQLRSQPRGIACGGFVCGVFSPHGPFEGCPFNCLCVFPADGSTTGVCSGSFPSRTPGK
jgi:hypothetical protein